MAKLDKDTRYALELFSKNPPAPKRFRSRAVRDDEYLRAYGYNRFIATDGEYIQVIDKRVPRLFDCYLKPTGVKRIWQVCVALEDHQKNVYPIVWRGDSP